MLKPPKTLQCENPSMREAAATFRTAKEAVLAQLTFSGALVKKMAVNGC